jgi:hypothetical protein
LQVLLLLPLVLLLRVVIMWLHGRLGGCILLLLGDVVVLLPLLCVMGL